jgi:hypothetical protein
LAQQFFAHPCFSLLPLLLMLRTLLPQCHACCCSAGGSSRARLWPCSLQWRDEYACAAFSAATLSVSAVPRVLLQCWRKLAHMRYLARAALLTALLFWAARTARR